MATTTTTGSETDGDKSDGDDSCEPKDPEMAHIVRKDPELEFKGASASYDAEYPTYQTKCDSIHGRPDDTVEAMGDSLVVAGKTGAPSYTCDPTETRSHEHGADYACEPTDMFRIPDKIQPHPKAGAQQVSMPAPTQVDTHTIVDSASPTSALQRIQHGIEAMNAEEVQAGLAEANSIGLELKPRLRTMLSQWLSIHDPATVDDSVAHHHNPEANDSEARH